MSKFPTPGKPVRGSRSGAPIMALFDLLGRRWAMGVLWVLCQSGPGTFRELQERCENVSPTVLNARLKELREAGLIERGAGGYGPTAMGRELYEALAPLKLWSRRWSEQIAGEAS